MDVLARMLEATVVTLREGVEAALVVAITLAYLRKCGRGELARYVYWGVAAAVVASAVSALAVQRWGLDPENELWEGSLMLLAAALVGSLAAWMWRAGRRTKERAEARLAALVGRPSGKGIGGLGLFGFTFVMVFREGVEAALFVGALSGAIGANPLYNVLGGGVGLLLAAVFGVLLVQGGLRLDIRRFFGVTGLVLFLLVAKLVANGLHEFFEARLLPSSPRVLTVVGLLTREGTSILVLVLLIGIPAALLLREALARCPDDSVPGEPPAEHRKRRAEARAARLWTGTAGVTGVALSLLLVLSTIAVARGYDPTPVPITPGGPVLRIPVEELRAQPMRKYVVDIDGVNIRFLVVRGEDQRLAVAFDACAICPLRGYSLHGSQIVCGNCGAPISLDTIGIPGGCNPVPLKARVKDGALLIRVEDLAEGKARFAPGA